MDMIAELPGIAALPSGKVRERYVVEDDVLLLVASDRISAYDCVLPTRIPDKGAVLTAMSDFWFGVLDVPNHRITCDPRVSAAGARPEPLSAVTARVAASKYSA
jgi:phosphoribosylaminoimidazole-succinocarboxamide synthase